jgi:hypothetical protein
MFLGLCLTAKYFQLSVFQLVLRKAKKKKQEVSLKKILAEVLLGNLHMIVLVFHAKLYRNFSKACITMA